MRRGDDLGELGSYCAALAELSTMTSSPGWYGLGEKLDDDGRR